MLKRDELTRQEIVDFLISGRDNNIPRSLEEPSCHYTKEQLEAVNDYIDYLVDEFGDKDLAYNTDTGFFDYVGPLLPE